MREDFRGDPWEGWWQRPKVPPSEMRGELWHKPKAIGCEFEGEAVSDLMKSVRELKACEKCASMPRIWDATRAVNNGGCDACLCLVLAHCGDKAAEEVEGRTSLFIQNDRFKRKGAYQVADAIRREFGVKL